MIQIRPFLNSDPPGIIAVWNAQHEAKHLARQMKVSTLEHFVLAKPYFDREGMLLAVDDGRTVGFVHAGFGPNPAHSEIDQAMGIICTVQVKPEFESPELHSQLLQAAESYLKSRGAQRILGGPVSPYACFYHGLSAMGESAGVLDEDRALQAAYRAAGYTEFTRNMVLHRDLTAFRPPFDRKQRTLQRNYEVTVDLETDLSDWWELCRYGPLPRCGFLAVDRTSRATVGRVIWWDQAFTGAALQSTVSFTRLEVPEEIRRLGLGTLLMNEAMKQLKSSGAFYASAQVDETNQIAIAFFQSLGFKEITRGTTFIKG